MTTGHETRGGGTALTALLRGAVDYAGLFPPAELDMPGATAEYAAYLHSADVWALGRFVVPAARLDELAEVAPREATTSLGAPTPVRGLSVVLGTDLASDAQRVRTHRDAHGPSPTQWWGRVEAVELRAATVDAISEALRAISADVERFVEIPIGGDVVPLVRAIRDGAAAAKVRTGGTAADAFPASGDLARFLATCVAERVPFKATAGLHHPLRGDYPLTYAPGSATGLMFGFLNVLLAATLLRAGHDEAVARELLEERDPSSIHFDADGVTWRDRRVSATELAATRTSAMQSFGSCSFREPIDDLTALGLL